MRLTRGPDDVFYGMASFGGQNGNGTIFKINASGEFTVLHTFSALDVNAHNEDGANPLRTSGIGDDDNLVWDHPARRAKYVWHFPRPNSCGVAWVMDRWGNNLAFCISSPHRRPRSLAAAGAGRIFYGCAVWPATSLPWTPRSVALRDLVSDVTIGGRFDVLYTFTQTDANGAN